MEYQTLNVPHIPMAHINALSDSEKKLYKPELPDDAKDQMTLKFTVGDRRNLEAKAAVTRRSATKWLVDAIELVPARLENLGNSVSGGISFALDKRRAIGAEKLAKQLGFRSAEDLAKDLMLQAVNNPEKAEKFLFGDS